MKIYEKIFDRLDELHMSQMELSRRTGIATSTISDWRKKKINPQADKIVSICRALDMSLVDLLCDEETVEPAAQIDCLTNENYMIELFRQSDAESKRRIISYIELLEVCKQINNACQSRKRQRNVSIIQDIDGNNIVVINDIRFKGKRNVSATRTYVFYTYRFYTTYPHISCTSSSPFTALLLLFILFTSPICIFCL